MNTKEYVVDIDLYKKDYGVVETIGTVGQFDSFKAAKKFARDYAKTKSNFKKNWLNNADVIELTIRHNVEFDENGEANDWDDEDVVKVMNNG